MSLPLPGERRTHHVWELVLALVVVFGLCALGCASGASARHVPPSVFKGDRFQAKRSGRAAPRPRAGAEVEASAALVERRLNVLGYRFGTDGTVPALWGYMRAAHHVIPVGEVRPGDVLFFDTRGVGPQPTCADHVALAEAVGPDGRITFVEARGGHVRRSVVDPGHPALRRDARGRITEQLPAPDGHGRPAGQPLLRGRHAVRRRAPRRPLGERIHANRIAPGANDVGPGDGYLPEITGEFCGAAVALLLRRGRRSEPYGHHA